MLKRKIQWSVSTRKLVCTCTSNPRRNRQSFFAPRPWLWLNRRWSTNVISRNESKSKQDVSICLPWNWSGLLMFIKTYSSMCYFCLQNIQKQFQNCLLVFHLGVRIKEWSCWFSPLSVWPHQLQLSSSHLFSNVLLSLSPFYYEHVFFSVPTWSSSYTILWFTMKWMMYTFYCISSFPLWS